MNTNILEKYRKMIDESCIGYSTDIHWNFFKQILNNPEIKDICILGVYYGRDIAYIASILESLGNRNYKIFGVDKFEDSSGNDWPEETRGLTWKEAGFGSAPDIRKTRDNLTKLGLDTNVFLYQDLAENFLASAEELFDFIYIDLSHDYETTVNAIQLAIHKIKPSGIIAGDDFSNQGTWGVASAVQDSFSKYEVINNWIWLANPGDFILKKITQEPMNINKDALNITHQGIHVLDRVLSAYYTEGYIPSVGLNPWRESNRDASFAALLKIDNSLQRLHLLSTGGGIAIDEIYFFEMLLTKFKPKKEFLIGIASGWSTIALGLINSDAYLYGIDNLSEGIEAQEGLDLTKRIANKLSINLNIYIGTSPEDVPSFLDRIGGNIDFVFIDGLHTNEQLFLDFQCILPYLAESSIVVCHDVLNWSMIEGFEKVVQLATEFEFSHEILRRTSSGMGILSRKISEEVESVILAFYQDPLISHI